MAMTSVPSFKVFHEPYVIANMFGKDRRIFLDQPPVPGCSYSDMVRSLQADYPGKTFVFGKDFPQNLHGNMANLPAGYIHTFLIRDPQKAGISHFQESMANLKSLRDKEVSIKNIAYYMNMLPMLELYHYVCDVLQQKPIVIESDDLVNSPREVVQKYCSQTGLPFHESMLSWKPGNTGDWFHKFLEQPFINYYSTAIESSSFLPPASVPKKTVREEFEVPEEILNVIESNRQIYAELIRNKIQV
ncbi:uncharacterized protein LOC144436501 [Glandiceps talaboti]